MTVGCDAAALRWAQILLQAVCVSLLLLSNLSSDVAPSSSTGAPSLRVAFLQDRLERHRTLVESVMAEHSSRLTAATWDVGAPPGAAPAPLFFLTAAAGWGRFGKSGAAEVAVRQEQYASNIGGILALGFRVLLAVSPGPPDAPPSFPLAEALSAAAAPGQLRVHFCSQGTRVRERSGGPDEILCIQEALLALFRNCVVPGRPAAALTGAPGCPGEHAHVVRMSGRYLLAKPHLLLRAVRERGSRVDAFVKWAEDWVETNPAAKAVDPNWRPFRRKQVQTFALSMKVRLGQTVGRGGGGVLWLCRGSPHPPRTLLPFQFSHFIDCHLNRMTDDADWSENSTSMWRFAIELLTADCISELQYETMPYLGVVANVGNSAEFLCVCETTREGKRCPILPITLQPTSRYF